jgi:hypothetical protein
MTYEWNVADQARPEKKRWRDILSSYARHGGRPPAVVVALASFLVLSSNPGIALAQYNSGSLGTHGVFPPVATPANARYLLWDIKTGLVRFCSEYDADKRRDTCTTEVGTAQIQGIPPGGLTSGVFEFSTVDVSVAPNLTALDIYPVGYDGPTPLTILSQTSFRLRAQVFLRLTGAPGESSQTVGLPPNGFAAAGGRSGPGGFAGGAGGKMGAPSLAGNAGGGPTGGAGGPANAANQNGGSFGAHAGPTPVSTSLIPLIGGSGGGGSGGYDTICGLRGAGGGGGGGGGALLVAANVQIVLDSASGIDARGGVGAVGCPTFFGSRGGTGSGGSIRLAASTISGGGFVSVGNGIVRIEGNAVGYTGNIDTVRGTVITAPQPAIVNDFPSLRMTSIGGLAVGPNPTGSASTPDVTFQTAPAGPVTVELAASNIPVGTVVNLRANPVIGTPTTATSSALAGTVQSATANASLTIPPGAGVITAVTSFPVTTAMLETLPAVPGLTPTRIEVLADATGTSRVFMVGVDGMRAELTMNPQGRFEIAP